MVLYFFSLLFWRLSTWRLSCSGSYCAWLGNLNFAQEGGWSYHVACTWSTTPTSQLRIIPVNAVVWSGLDRKTYHAARRSHPHARKYARGGEVRPTNDSLRDGARLLATCRTPHGALCLVQAISAWSVKVRRSPSSILGMRGYMVPRTTGMPGMMVTPPPSPLSSTLTLETTRP